MKKAGSIILVAVTMLFVLAVAGMYLYRNGRSGDITVNTLPAHTCKTTLPEHTVSNEAHEWRININTATAEELDLLPGIGPALAERILNYREEHGSFSNIAELANVNGIGEATIEDLKDYVILEEAP